MQSLENDDVSLLARSHFACNPRTMFWLVRREFPGGRHTITQDLNGEFNYDEELTGARWTRDMIIWLEKRKVRKSGLSQTLPLLERPRRLMGARRIKRMIQMNSKSSFVYVTFCHLTVIVSDYRRTMDVIRLNEQWIEKWCINRLAELKETLLSSVHLFTTNNPALVWFLSNSYVYSEEKTARNSER